MRVANLSDVKNELSAYVDSVRKGGRVRILVRGVAAADLVPVDEEPTGWTTELASLERRGMIRRGQSGVAKEILEAGPKVRAGAVARSIDEERGDRAVTS